MQKRIRTGYLASLLLAFAALAIVMLRVGDPHSRAIGAIVYALSWVVVVVVARRHQRVREGARASKQKLAQIWQERRAVIGQVVGLLAVGAAGLILLPPDDVPFVRLDEAQVTARIETDRSRLMRAMKGIDHAGKVAVEALANVEAEQTTEVVIKERVRRAWASYLDYAVELDQLVDVHEHFYQMSPIDHGQFRAQSFLIGFVALVAQVDTGLAISQAVDNARAVETLLNEANPTLGLTKDTYLRLRMGLSRADTLLRLQAAHAYVKWLGARGFYKSPADAELVHQTRERNKGILKRLGEDPEVLLDNPLDTFENLAFVAWLPLQKHVAVGISVIRTTHRENFVSLEDIARIRPQLAPGDVLLERRNWYLTNIGLPGFWPHAALHTGTLAEMDAYFADDAARTPTGGAAPSAYLAEHLPKVHAALASKSAQGYENSVIEAIGEGVVIDPLEQSAHADYVAALRPRLSKADTLASLLRAFSHFGKPYDYDFDFVTDETVVCSELVFKALQPAPNKAGIDFPLTPTSGRLVLPPNDIVKKFDDEFGTDEAELDFVVFYDGSEEQQAAFEKDAESLRASWRRPKWDIAQP
jgi:hypothetical protein